jgi:EAL domain-containing protein (putative c-di-GMP-specific phosphodiesterase class I)
MDDFGTGYSSLAYLKRFPFDSVKIDQSFIRGIPANRDDCAIVEAILAMAQSLNLKVVAEGVETQEQSEFLRKLGCDQIQGYVFSKPIPSAEIVALLYKTMTREATAQVGS